MNRDRLLKAGVVARFPELLMASPELKPLVISEQFAVNGASLRAWASHSSLERNDKGDDEPAPHRGGNGLGTPPARRKKRARGDFRGLLLSNQPHCSSSDREARLFRGSNGTGASLSCLRHGLMETRHGLVVASEVTPANGDRERAAAVRMARSHPGAHPKRLGAHRRDDTRDVVADLRNSRIRPPVGQGIQARRRSTVDGPSSRHPGYGTPINARRRIEQRFGWINQAAGLRQFEGPRPITGGGVPAGCGGLQPDPPGQAARSQGSAGIKGGTPAAAAISLCPAERMRGERPAAEVSAPRQAAAPSRWIPVRSPDFAAISAASWPGIGTGTAS